MILINKINQIQKEFEPKLEEAKKGSLEDFKKILNEKPLINIGRNKYGNYEHIPSKLLFRRDDKVAYGHQNYDGTISVLTQEDIENCKKYGFE